MNGISRELEVIVHINMAIRNQCVIEGGHDEYVRFQRVEHVEHWHVIAWEDDRWIYQQPCRSEHGVLRETYAPREVIVRCEDVGLLKHVLTVGEGLLDVYPGVYIRIGQQRGRS